VPNVWDPPQGWTGTLEQAWFAGVHCDVGGGETPDGLANEALHWIVEKAEGLGLTFDATYLQYYRNCFNATLHDSMTVAYRLLGQNIRVIGGHGATERLHQSAIDRCNLTSCKYSPSNLTAYRTQNPNAPCYRTTRVPCGTPC
jgi:hypothetical protein